MRRNIVRRALSTDTPAKRATRSRPPFSIFVSTTSKQWIDAMLNTQETDPPQPPKHFGFATADHYRERTKSGRPCPIHARMRAAP